MMLARNAPRITSRLRTFARPTPFLPRSPLRPAQCRRFATNGQPAGTPAAAQGTNGVGALAPFVSELDKLAPSFDIRGSQIRILRTPAEFYGTLREKILSAKERIFLSTLYIGRSEQELIDTLREALTKNPNLKLSILTDALRGTREAPAASSASLLATLVDDFGPARVEIRMYHTPNLTGLRKKYVPRRINEGWGLQHMKLYGVDDEIIISGANLSADYFTNRQDRYHLFTSKEVTDYFRRIHEGVASLSFLVQPSTEPSGFTLTWPAANPAPSPLENPSAFVRGATATMAPLISDTATSSHPQGGALSKGVQDTRVYIISQMSQLLRPDTSTELPSITRVFELLARPEYRDSSWTFTAGYFNPAPSLTKLFLSTAQSTPTPTSASAATTIPTAPPSAPAAMSTVITASPYANGFYNSPGVSGLLPGGYTHLLRTFLEAVRASGRTDIQTKEWRRGTVGEPGAWTYHAKGLWVTLPREANPSITVVGSSNYTKRSYSLDLEVGALVVTRDEDLKRRLGEERAWLAEHATETTIEDLTKVERRVGIRVRLAMLAVKLAGGAL